MGASRVDVVLEIMLNELRENTLGSGVALIIKKRAPATSPKTTKTVLGVHVESLPYDLREVVGPMRALLYRSTSKKLVA